MTIKFTDAVKFHKDLPHQNRAWEFLQTSVNKEVLDEFARIYRNETQVINSSSIPKQALDIIKEFEGFSSKAYYDPHTGALPITIAYGSTRKMNGTPFYIGETITKEEGEKLLIYQLNKEFLPPLQKIPYWNEMNDEMKSALLDFVYNLGANFYGASGFNTITRVLKEKKWNEVPAALELYRNPGSNVEAGLLRRRRREGLLWREGLSKLSKK
jgi:lysozyme